MREDESAPLQSAEQREAGFLARCAAWRAEGMTPEQAYERLRQAQDLPNISVLRLLRHAYVLTLEQARDVMGVGSPFRTPEETTRYLQGELGYCPCVGAEPIFFLRDVLQLLHGRLQATGQETADEFQAKSQGFMERAALDAGGAHGSGPWFVLLLQHKGLLFHNRNVNDSVLTRKGVHLLEALNVLVASEGLPDLLGNLGRP